MKKFKFKDGSIITASTVEEAKATHKAMAGGQYEDIKARESILKELGFKKKSWFYSVDLIKYNFEMPSGTRKYALSLGVSDESPEFSRVFLYRRYEEKEDILSTYVKNNKDFKKNIQKLIVKATKIASSFERWCDNK